MAAAGCLVICCLCPAQQDINLIIKELTASRKRLPPIAAKYREELRVPNNPGEPKDNFNGGMRVRFTWGDHNTDLVYKFAFGSQATYREIIGIENDPDWTRGHDKDLWTGGGEYLRSVSDGAQGAISKIKPGWVNPLGVGYEVRMGEPVTELLSLAGARMTGPDVAEVRQGPTILTFEFKRFGDQLAVREYSSYGPEHAETVSVDTWVSKGAMHFPKDITIVRRQNGELVQTLHYKLVKLLPRAELLLQWQGWSENAIVRNMTTLELFRYRKGELFLDPMLNQKAGSFVSIGRLALLALAALLGLIVAWKLNKRRSQAPARRT